MIGQSNWFWFYDTQVKTDVFEIKLKAVSSQLILVASQSVLTRTKGAFMQPLITGQVQTDSLRCVQLSKV